MVKQAKRLRFRSRSAHANQPKGILELDRFSDATLTKWLEISRDLDQLQDTMFFSLEPQRRRLRSQLLDALAVEEGLAVDCTDWVRIVDYKFSLSPLSSAGSLLSYGGRFNVGQDLDPNTLNPWPALYLASDEETAFCEKFQNKPTDLTDGLRPEDLALTPRRSHSTVFLRGLINNVFDLTVNDHLHAFCKILAKIKMPESAKKLNRKIGISDKQHRMIRTAIQLRQTVLEFNWRIDPIQYGMPATSHLFAEMVRAAGFEGILYPSTMGRGNCLAIFPDKLSDASYIELADSGPNEIIHRRLDVSSADVLAGWGIIPSSLSKPL